MSVFYTYKAKLILKLVQLVTIRKNFLIKINGKKYKNEWQKRQNKRKASIGAEGKK